MDNKIIIIGDRVVSSALGQVLDTFAFNQRIFIDPAKFSNVALLLEAFEKHKDDKDVRGIILTEPDGVELAKHIRLTDDLGGLCLLPLFLISARSVEQLLSEKADNIFLLSPGCHALHVSDCIPKLLNVLPTAKSFASLEEMKKAIRTYVIWSEDDDVISRHDNFNRYGPIKLMKELYGTLPQQQDAEFGRMADTLWFKKYHFFESGKGAHAGNHTIDEELFKKTIANKRILYIDDEHRLGWSSALYSIITGNGSQEVSSLFQENKRVVAPPDGKFTCIDTYEDASNMFEAKKKEFPQALAAYSDAEYKKNTLSEQLAGERDKANKLTAELQKAKENFERSSKSMQESEAKAKESGSSLKKHVMDLVDEAMKSTKEIEVTDISPLFKPAKEVFELYERENSALVKYKEEFKRNKDLLDKLTVDHEKQKQSLEQVKTDHGSAVKRNDEALRALSPGTLFPFDLVISDLRLERIKDKDALPHEISGVKLLKQIKEYDPSIPVIIFTASEKAVNYKEVTDYGASGYWIKSINTLADLKMEMVQSLSRAKELRPLWLDIKKVEAKKHLVFMRENPSTRTLEKNILGASQKNEIVMLLKESFLLLIRESLPYEETICNYTNYAKIVLNMGMVQEERFGRLAGDKWDQWVRQKKIDQDETAIRQIRNKAAHQANAGITEREALEAFQKTLERCLRA